MEFDFPVYSLVFFAGSGVALFLAAVFYTRRPARGAMPLTWLAMFCALWALSAGLEAGAVTVAHKILFSQIEYPGIVGASLSWLIFTLDYAGSGWWRRPRNIILVSFIPILTLIIVFTNNLHHWYWSGTVFESTSFGLILIYLRGPWYWVFVIYTYLIYVAGVFIILRFGFREQHFYRLQLAAIAFGTLIPFIASLLYLFDMLAVKGLDLAPFSFILTAVVYSFTLFRLRFLDVVPVARGLLVEKMPDGIMVVNSEGLIMDMNPAAERMSGVTRSAGMGSPAAGAWPKLAGIMSAADSGGRTEMVIQGSRPPIISGRAYYAPFE